MRSPQSAGLDDRLPIWSRIGQAHAAGGGCHRQIVNKSWDSVFYMLGITAIMVADRCETEVATWKRMIPGRFSGLNAGPVAAGLTIFL
ncbi:MAG: hypothetical protein B7Z58_01350 [Acidiphilium sp. 37-64-53]|nr:MAG: hypothetical protein B7Z58_01350 [Acidiphilium sp. 37-64-53]